MRLHRLAEGGVALLVGLASPAWADDKPISGTVLDAAGKPVANAEVAVGWNCSGKDNRLEPAQKIKTDRTGRFSGTIPCEDKPVPVMALDKERNLGVLKVVAVKDLSKPIKLELAPMGEVTGQIELGEFENAPSKFKLDVIVTPEDVNLLSFEIGSPKIALRLPAGRYALGIAAEGAQAVSEEIEITSKETKIDLGKLAIEPTKAAAKSGTAAPKWNVTEARGVKKDVTLADYKGKWVLIEFWGFW